MVQETTIINNKALLPLRGFLYGPLNVAGQFFAVTISRLICQPNLTFEASSTFRGQLLSLANKIDNNEEKIEENSDKVNQNEDDIETNQNNIVTHQNNIVTHQNNILTNQNNVNKINLKIADHKSILNKNEAKIDEHSGKVSQITAYILKNRVKIGKANVNIADNKNKIRKNTEEIKLRDLGIFAKCQNKWCLQKGLQKPQHTKCESITNDGMTCNNPKIWNNYWWSTKKIH